MCRWMQAALESPTASNWLKLDPELLAEASTMTSFQCTECPKVCLSIDTHSEKHSVVPALTI